MKTKKTEAESETNARLENRRSRNAGEEDRQAVTKSGAAEKGDREEQEEETSRNRKAEENER